MFWHMGVYDPATLKNNFEMLKKYEKNLARTSRNSMCACQVSCETDFFVDCVKTTTKSRVKILFYIKFCLFLDMAQKILVLRETTS